MGSTILIWTVGTAVIGVVFSRALHRWADRRTANRFAHHWSHRSPLMRALDSTPHPGDELTPCP